MSVETTEKQVSKQPAYVRVLLAFLASMTIGLAADLWTKKAVFDWLEQKPDRSVSIIDGFLKFVMAENSGAVFGIAPGKRWLFTTVSIIALAVIFLILLTSKSERGLFYIAIGMYTAGICGNLYDRIFNDGLVRDFIDIVYWPGRHWPAFNVADSMLCVSVGLIIIGVLTGKAQSS